MKRLICLYGGPGTGKTTTTNGLMFEAKKFGINAELAREYVKNWCWEGREIKPGDQVYFFAKQSRRERLLMQAGVELIITDSPVLLSHYYGQKYDEFEQLTPTIPHLLAQHAEVCKKYGYTVEHIFLTRTKPYLQAGRYQNEGEAKECDNEIRQMLVDMGYDFRVVEYGYNWIDEILGGLNEIQV